MLLVNDDLVLMSNDEGVRNVPNLKVNVTKRKVLLYER